MVKKRAAQRTPMHYRKKSRVLVGECAGAPTIGATLVILEKSLTLTRSNADESRYVVPGVRLHCRGAHTLERGATILLPSSMVDSLNPSGQILGLALAGNEALKPNGGLSAAPPGVAPAARSAA